MIQRRPSAKGKALPQRVQTVKAARCAFADALSDPYMTRFAVTAFLRPALEGNRVYRDPHHWPVRLSKRAASGRTVPG